MTSHARSPALASLAWRLTLTAIIVRMVYAALMQSYLLFGLPHSEHLREIFSQPQYLMPQLAFMVTSTLLIGLTVWGTTHRWLRQHNAQAVDKPRVRLGSFIVLLLILSLAVSATTTYLHGALVRYLIAQAGSPNDFITMALFQIVLTIALEVLAAYIALRMVLWPAQPAGAAGGPAFEQRHAAWNSGWMVLGWQLSVCVGVGSYLQVEASNVGWLGLALGYLILPAAISLLCTYVCLRILPPTMGTSHQGRALAHGTLTFWLAQVLGVGVVFLVIRALSWGQLIRFAESNVAAVLMLLMYAALLVLGCRLGKRVLYRAATRPAPAG